MLRRRGPLQPLRRAMRASGLLGERPKQLLREAHRLVELQRYAEAAALFAQLADGAARLGMPARAAHLALFATRAYLEAGDTPNTLTRARQALQFWLDAERESKAQPVFTQLIADLRARALHAEANTLLNEFPHLSDTLTAADTPTSRGQLPAQCPNCGGPLRSDEVDWVDETSAECAYCGGVVKTE